LGTFQIFASSFLPSSDFLVLRYQPFSYFCHNEEGRESPTISDAGKEKAAVEEKGKRGSHRTRIRMDLDTKTSKLCDQEAVDRYLVSYGFRLNLRIKIEFCPHSVEVSLAPPNREAVYMHP